MAPAVRLPAQTTLAVSAELQQQPPSPPHGHAQHLPPAVLWLKPMGSLGVVAFSPQGSYVLSQKNKTFSPHVLVVPVGASVAFPNHDPFFHNVFSLFDGKRFDLGLYEAGKTKNVVFSREGVSYIFCNIHPEMSAVVLSLTTPLFSIANASGQFLIPDVPPGEYEIHLWVEGQTESNLARWVHTVHLSSTNQRLGPFLIPASTGPRQPHTNKFGEPYGPERDPAY